MRCVLPHARPELFSNRTLVGVGRIGGTDDVAPMCDCVLSFQREDHDGTATHELDEASEERSLAMHGVEAFSLCLTQMYLAHAEDAETFVQNALQNDALLLELDDVRLNDRQSALNGHCGRIYTLSWPLGQNLAKVAGCFYGRATMSPLRTFCWPIFFGGAILFFSGCSDFLPPVADEETMDPAGDGDGDSGYEGEPGTCDAWKISYCEAIEQCSAFATHEDCQLDVGYVRCAETAPVGRCEAEIDEALAADDCDALPRDCTPQVIADRTIPSQICGDIYEALCEHDFFCGAAVSIETCVSSLQASTPCSEYTAVLPQGEDCPGAIGLISCGDDLPATCMAVLRY